MMNDRDAYLARQRHPAAPRSSTSHSGGVANRIRLGKEDGAGCPPLLLDGSNCPAVAARQHGKVHLSGCWRIWSRKSAVSATYVPCAYHLID